MTLIIAPIAALTLDQKILARVIHPEQNFTDDYAGIFHLRVNRTAVWFNFIIQILMYD